MGALQAQLTPVRLAPYLQAERGDLRRALARYYWNAELCRTYYPILQALEVALRNSLDRALAPAFPVRNFEHVDSWLDRRPRVVVHVGGDDAVARAKSKLTGWDPVQNCYRHAPPKHGDLVAGMSFGFWVGLLEAAYDNPGTRGVYFWPDQAKRVFPGASGETMTTIRVAFNELRHFRNRVFHHEPVWPKKPQSPTPKAQYDAILKALRWLGGQQAQVASRIHKGTAVFDEVDQIAQMEFRLLAVIEEILEQAKTKKTAKVINKDANGAS